MTDEIWQLDKHLGEYPKTAGELGWKDSYTDADMRKSSIRSRRSSYTADMYAAVSYILATTRKAVDGKLYPVNLRRGNADAFYMGILGVEGNTLENRLLRLLGALEEAGFIANARIPGTGAPGGPRRRYYVNHPLMVAWRKWLRRSGVVADTAAVERMVKERSPENSRAREKSAARLVRACRCSAWAREVKKKVEAVRIGVPLSIPLVSRLKKLSGGDVALAVLGSAMKDPVWVETEKEMAWFNGRYAEDVRKLSETITAKNPEKGTDLLVCSKEVADFDSRYILIGGYGSNISCPPQHSPLSSTAKTDIPANLSGIGNNGHGKPENLLYTNYESFSCPDEHQKQTFPTPESGGASGTAIGKPPACQQTLADTLLPMLERRGGPGLVYGSSLSRVVRVNYRCYSPMALLPSRGEDSERKRVLRSLEDAGIHVYAYDVNASIHRLTRSLGLGWFDLQTPDIYAEVYRSAYGKELAPKGSEPRMGEMGRDAFKRLMLRLYFSKSPGTFASSVLYGLNNGYEPGEDPFLDWCHSTLFKGLDTRRDHSFCHGVLKGHATVLLGRMRELLGEPRQARIFCLESLLMLKASNYILSCFGLLSAVVFDELVVLDPSGLPEERLRSMVEGALSATFHEIRGFDLPTPCQDA